MKKLLIIASLCALPINASAQTLDASMAKKALTQCADENSGYAGRVNCLQKALEGLTAFVDPPAEYATDAKIFCDKEWGEEYADYRAECLRQEAAARLLIDMITGTLK